MTFSFDRLYTFLDNFAHSLLQAAIVLVVLLLIARVLTLLIHHTFLSKMNVERRGLSERRRKTLKVLAVMIAMFVVLATYIQPAALFTFLGLFSAGLGFSAKPYVSDILGGISLLFEDQFALGDKVEIGDRNVIGTVEQITLRVTYIRGEFGELWLVPNGDVRTIRNFTRGTWSPANIRLTVPTSKLDETLLVLNELVENPGDNVIEQPEIISEEGEMGAVNTTITLKVKATYGTAPIVRRRLLTQLQAALAEHHVLAE